jgi:signal transduction histidine kinase
MKILVIEDNPDHALLTKRVLEKANQGYQVNSAREAEEGLRMIIEESYDLVICDYRLPGLSALDVLKKMSEKRQDLPFVVVTSSGSEKIAVELMKEGAYDYVVKDSSYEDALPIVIQRAIDRYNVKKEKERLEKELRESNEKLKEMYEIKSSFTSMVSHELRTPLTAIKEGIAIMLDGSAGEINADQKEFLDIAKRNVDRLKRLIDDVLDFSKLESKKMVFKMQKGDIMQTIKEVVAVQKPVAEERNLYLKAELDGSISKIEFDSDRMNQVLNNLVSNAIKFTKIGGVAISVSEDREENTVVVCVKDTGKGIKKDDLPKLFQKFQQLGGPNQRKTGGTGLGLSISKEIIEQHGGKIWVESQYGKGSEFKFILPIKKRYKVLVIDDDKGVLDICETFLKNNGYIVLRSESGMEGLKAIQSNMPDLIVVDMRLNDISGYDVIDRLRSSNGTFARPILVMSGYADEIAKIENRKEELSLPWISKPFNNDEFLSKVESLLMNWA